MRPRSILPSNSGLMTPTVSRIRPFSIDLSLSQSARESFDKRVSFADRRGCTRRSAGRPVTDERGTIVTVEETSFASVLETIMHRRVFGTSAPRAGSGLTQTNEPFTTKANLLYRLEQIRDLSDAIPGARNDTH